MNWKLALDVQMDMHKWHASEDGLALTFGFFDDFFNRKVDQTSKHPYTKNDRESDAVKMAKNIVSTLWRADTMYVTTEMQHLLLQAAHDLPPDAEFNVQNLITPVGFCLFEETMYGEDVHGDTVAVSGMAWHTAPVREWFDEDTGETHSLDEPQTVIAIYFYTPTDDPEDIANRTWVPALRDQGIVIPPLALAHFYPGLEGKKVPATVPEVKGAELIMGMLRLFLAIQYIGQQPIGQPVRLRPDRATRKRFIREHPDEPERLISLITLRRKKVKKDDEEPQKVEWSRRWVVRGFWRKQWYPKAGRHDWKYIHEYIKGPEDKPLIITERRVFNFRR